MTTDEKVDQLLKHTKNVRENCELLGKKFIEQGKLQLGLALIARGQIHDASKWGGIEWEFLDPTGTNKVGLKNAVLHHTKTNSHHPEFWPKGIQEMPELDLCELVCDWKARSTEFANDLREWINGKALKKFGFTKESDTYKKIMTYVDMVCDKPFVEEPEQAEQPKELVPA